jgi:DNA repair exonuclease SbcCD ATPase subunit
VGTGRGLTNADLVNDDSKVARVTLHGTVNAAPFTITRTAGRRGRGSSLTFLLDGTDLTTQEMKLTQAAIDERLGAPLLGRTVFYGQSEITALLEGNDRGFKEELGKLVDLRVWEGAKAVAQGEVGSR